MQIAIEEQFKIAHQFIKWNYLLSAVTWSLVGDHLYPSNNLDLVIPLIIYHAINVKYILVTNIVIKQMVRNLSGQIFIGVFYTSKTSAIIILLNLFAKLFLWNGTNGGLMRLYPNLRHITTVFLLQIHNQYLWIELKT